MFQEVSLLGNLVILCESFALPFKARSATDPCLLNEEIIFAVIYANLNCEKKPEKIQDFNRILNP